MALCLLNSAPLSRRATLPDLCIDRAAHQSDWPRGAFEYESYNSDLFPSITHRISRSLRVVGSLLAVRLMWAPEGRPALGEASYNPRDPPRLADRTTVTETEPKFSWNRTALFANGDSYIYVPEPFGGITGSRLVTRHIREARYENSCHFPESSALLSIVLCSA